MADGRGTWQSAVGALIGLLVAGAIIGSQSGHFVRDFSIFAGAGVVVVALKVAIANRHRDPTL
jgi:hypothetical protein